VIGAQPLDEAPVARRAHVGDDDVIEGALLGAATGKTKLESHCGCPVLLSLVSTENYFLRPSPGRPGKRGAPPPSPGRPGPPAALSSALTSLGRAFWPAGAAPAPASACNCAGSMPA